MRSQKRRLNCPISYAQHIIPINDFLLHTHFTYCQSAAATGCRKSLRFSVSGLAQSFDFRLLLLRLAYSTQHFLLLIDLSSTGCAFDHVLIDILCAGLHRLRRVHARLWIGTLPFDVSFPCCFLRKMDGLFVTLLLSLQSLFAPSGFYR